jgi:thiol-disulfide isomerase/thioredoxin
VKIAHALLIAFLLSFSPGTWAEGWSLKDTTGVRYSLSSLHGRWVLVNFWAPWCPTCLQEMPDLVALQKRQDVQVIGVAAMYKTRREVENVVKNQSISYPVVFGNEDIASDFGGMQGMPTSFLYSPNGKLIGQHAGPLTLSEIEYAIAHDGSALFTR